MACRVPRANAAYMGEHLVGRDWPGIVLDLVKKLGNGVTPDGGKFTPAPCR